MQRLRLHAMIVAAGIAAVSFAPAAIGQDGPTADGRPLVTVRELMEKTITPTTNTIWGAYDPPASEEEWQALEEAAITLLVAGQALALGGTGPMDRQWAENPAWRAFDQVMLGAANDALAAIRSRDHDALLTASDVLYPPCEGCHMQFHPGVVGAD